MTVLIPLCMLLQAFRFCRDSGHVVQASEMTGPGLERGGGVGGSQAGEVGGEVDPGSDADGRGWRRGGRRWRRGVRRWRGGRRGTWNSKAQQHAGPNLRTRSAWSGVIRHYHIIPDYSEYFLY